MSKEGGKDWERPWTTEEIVEHADDWNLACDAALLNTLKAFGDKILKKAEDVNEKIEKLNESLSKIHLQVDLSRNEFSSLRNTQFVECRVYDDDETLFLEKSKDEEEKTNVPEEETVEDFREAVALGLNILDEYYDKVKVTVSDSEGEDEDEPSYVYRRKDPYINRRLPLVIGSEEWHKKWHVGLEETDSENEQSSEKLSESESEDNVSEKKDHSDVSSELSHFSGLNTTKVQPLQVPTNRQQDLPASASGSDVSTEPVPKTLSFAEQLAAKLGSVIKEKDDSLKDPEINRRPIQKQPSDYGALFSNEPPPLDDVKTQESRGIFSDGKDLFDDEDEDDLWKPGDNKISSTKTISTGDPKQGIFREPEQGKGLFDDDSDDDIFASTKNRLANQQIKQPYLQTNKPLVPVFNEEPPLFDEEPNPKEKKKPTGGVSLFGESGPAIGKILKQRRVSSSEDEDEPKLNREEKKSSIGKDVSHEDEDFPRNKNASKPTISSVPQSLGPEKGKNLFDDDIFSDDLFSSAGKKSSTGLFEKSVLFSDDENDESFLSRAGSTSASESSIKTDKSKNLQTNIVQSPDDTDYSFRKNSKSNITTLFDELESDNDDIFVTKKDKNSGITNTEKSERKVEKNIKTKTGGLFDDLDDEDDLFSGLSKKNDGVKTKKSTSFLFDDNEDDDFDIFQSKDDKNDSGNAIKENTANETRNTERKVKDLADKSPKPKLNLFDDDSDDMDDLFSQISRKNDAKTSEKTSIISESSRTTNSPSLNEKTEISKDDSPAQVKTSENSRKPSISNKPAIESDPMKNSADNSENQNCENSMKNRDSSTETNDDNKGAIEEEKDKENAHTEIPEISIIEDTKITENSNESDKYKSSSGVLNVEFMDSIPPPDDDWDTYSDNAFDDMEQINDGLQSKASSLFDNEPPSLFFEDSGDISKDPANERLSSIESKPQNIPSDMFNSSDNEEEQNVSSTNANNDINANSDEKNPSVAPTSSLENIGTISTDTEKPEREYPENQSLENDKNGNKIKSKPPIAQKKPSTDKNSERTESLFDDNVDIDQIDFLFPKVKSRNDKNSNSEISEDIISGDKSCKKSVSFDSPQENRIESVETGVGTESEDDMQKNILKITEKLQQIANKPEERTKPIAVPGKLSHNLKINVGALLPGSALPKREKDQSPDQNEKLSKSLPASRFSLNEELSTKPHVPTKPITIVRGSSQEAPSTKEYRSLEKSVSFDGGTDIEVLQSITKDRPRIPVKRRPSSRRARQKSLRDSMSDFRLDDPIPDETSESDKRDSVDASVEEKKTLNIQTSVDSSDQKDKDSKNVTSEIFSDIENSEDLFKSLEKEIKNVNKANIISTKSKESKNELTKKVSDSLFQDDEDDLFESILTKEKRESERKISNRKDDTSHDKIKPIFTDSLEEKHEEHPGKIENKANIVKKTVDNLFDSSDDDDIFKSTKVSIIGRTVEGTSTKSRTEKPDKLFDFSDDEDFLDNFTRRKEDDETVDKKTDVKQQNNLLFDDMDNDDIFGTNSSTKNKTKQDVKPSVINKKPPKSTSLRKLENIEGEEDPLSALLK